MTFAGQRLHNKMFWRSVRQGRVAPRSPRGPPKTCAQTDWFVLERVKSQSAVSWHASAAHRGLDAVHARIKPIIVALRECWVRAPKLPQGILEVRETLVVPLAAKPEAGGLVQKLRALQEHKASVGQGVEHERVDRHALAVLWDAHRRVDRVVHVRRGRVPHVLVHPGQPGEQGAEHSPQGVLRQSARACPVWGGGCCPPQRWDVLDHGLPPALRQGVLF
mmetsp:Transcript_46556/g.124422  ORF Transcript_46556/g.124422 Transcript_46556/m.124422 type:complete len:220 (+) Transcript_46556:204-863(+)